ncbi:unnamed protein product [Parascedosporium putredinis]|uniref:Alpha-galactosidase n=1 Tax=Parascedosporium putredinis TaxID=1442378 RepID=A0A9P1MA92_9PEZI|nr:unnamed protein product [Parascedosporium putredinis]CAI7992336.1 unnamed protein product [Parascedosporium putredinis]
MATTQFDLGNETTGVVVDETSFALHGNNSSYRFHVDASSGDLISDHFGGPATENVALSNIAAHGWVEMPCRIWREFPDQGRGDFRIPAVRIRQSAGHTVSELRYTSHQVIPGKPSLPGLPATFGSEEDVSTLVVRMEDERARVVVELSYSIFPAHDAVVRSAKVTNNGNGEITIENLASFSVDLPSQELEMINLRGDWSREAFAERRKIHYGTQGFGSAVGYSSHLHNPFLAIVTPTTTESQGEAWGFSLVYTGSFAANVEKGSQGFTRAVLGFHPNHLSWPLAPGESLVTPECVAVYSTTGLGGMSRRFHRLFRDHLVRREWADRPRPALLNSWEGLSFDVNEDNIYALATDAADLGVKLFVLDDGWFGVKHPRLAETAALGIGRRIRLAQCGGQRHGEKLKFGLWFEPEMVNVRSSLYEAHPEWVLHAADYPRTEGRNQLVLNLSLPEVQDFLIASISKILGASAISYVKWDNNRGMHEMAHPSVAHRYILGAYRVFDVLTKRFPHVLWEGCASGGGRFDPGILHYFDQVWTSDNTDALERVRIQFNTSLVYPASVMGAHISAVPNWSTGRSTSIEFRAHVAMMGGSFGLELTPAEMPAEEKVKVPQLIALSERVNPVVIGGDLWRLSNPEESNWPAALFISRAGHQAVLFCFQLRAHLYHAFPFVKLQGLDPRARYRVTCNGEEAVYSGATLMNVGLQYIFYGDYQSRVVFLDRL